MDTVTLREYIEALFYEKGKALEAALASADKATTKAEAAAERRFELLNELRQGVATKEQVEALTKRIDELKERVDSSTGSSEGMKQGWGFLVGAVGFLVSIILLANMLT